MTPGTSNGAPRGAAAIQSNTTAAKGTGPASVLEVLEEIERQSLAALQRLKEGRAATGSSALSKIRYLADDGKRML
jgi:hypothetical protein